MKLLALILPIMMPMQGGITHDYGRIGVTVSRSSHEIIRVYPGSPAAEAGLEKGDIILESDWVEGTKFVDGIAGTKAHLKIRRPIHILDMEDDFNLELEFDIERVPPKQIYHPQKIAPQRPIDCMLPRDVLHPFSRR
jgi:C-terminal processing protease CtpA/Prc